MASSLTLHLLEASQHSCCFHLPAFHVFSDRVNDLKQRLDSLDVQGSVVVAILSSLGARASPHSALIGVDGPDLDIEKALPTSHEFVLSAGTRREHAWQAIADRALALCSSREILQVPTKQNIEILVALVQMLMRKWDSTGIFRVALTGCLATQSQKSAPSSHDSSCAMSSACSKTCSAKTARSRCRRF